MQALTRTLRNHPGSIGAVALALLAIAATVLYFLSSGPVRPDAGKCREEATAQVEDAIADGAEISTDMPPHCQGLPVKERDKIFTEGADDAIADEMERAREDIERMAGETGYETP
ncbi:hypothetical protein [Streptomyces fungicidicus]|uniref:hypothetical protein n=1 Tax=Streptomyces fungicidicus TaxID=68203 RepID=UPI0038173FB7